MRSLYTIYTLIIHLLFTTLLNCPLSTRHYVHSRRGRIRRSDQQRCRTSQLETTGVAALGERMSYGIVLVHSSDATAPRLQAGLACRSTWRSCWSTVGIGTRTQTMKRNREDELKTKSWMNLTLMEMSTFFILKLSTWNYQIEINACVCEKWTGRLLAS